MDVLARIAAGAAAAGFDLAAGFAVDGWNARGDYPLPDFGRPRALGVVLGNSRALWPVLAAALVDDPALAAGPDPLDRYTERTVAALMAASGVAADARLAHRAPYPPIQRIAAHAGLAHLQPSHLCVDAVRGPWIAMRAVLVLDVDGPEAPAPAPAPCDCRRGCLPAFERAAAAGFDPGDEVSWRRWVAIRDACPLGADQRYSDDQIRYHYSVDRSALTRAMAEVSARRSDPSP